MFMFYIPGLVEFLSEPACRAHLQHGNFDGDSLVSTLMPSNKSTRKEARNCSWKKSEHGSIGCWPRLVQSKAFKRLSFVSDATRCRTLWEAMDSYWKVSCLLKTCQIYEGHKLSKHFDNRRNLCWMAGCVWCFCSWDCHYTERDETDVLHKQEDKISSYSELQSFLQAKILCVSWAGWIMKAKELLPNCCGELKIIYTSFAHALNIQVL